MRIQLELESIWADINNKKKMILTFYLSIIFLFGTNTNLMEKIQQGSWLVKRIKVNLI